jgi:hypothetical protein
VEGNSRAGVHCHPDGLVRQPLVRREEEAAGLLNVPVDTAGQRRTAKVAAAFDPQLVVREAQPAEARTEAYRDHKQRSSHGFPSASNKDRLAARRGRQG